AFRQQMNLLESTDAQLLAVDQFFESQWKFGERLQYRLSESSESGLIDEIKTMATAA
ncbi:MAG: tRNA dihydrouridine synthase DusB, partial [Janthinobacterium sp.]